LATSEYQQRDTNSQTQPFQEFVARFEQIGAALTMRLTPASDSRIGRFRLQRVLGEGSFAKVWLAQDEELRRQVAIKLPTKALPNISDTDAYLAEAQTIAALDYPNIVPVFDVGKTDQGQVHIMTKFIEGGDLADWSREGIPPLEQSV